MKKVVFFTEPEWAFGQIHFSLMKYLFAHGISCEVLNFFKQYQKEEMRRIAANTDLFITTPVGAAWLVNYGVSMFQIRCVIHAKWDHYLGHKMFSDWGCMDYTKLQYMPVATVSEYLRDELFGEDSNIPVLHLGVESSRYTPRDKSFSGKISRVGYAGSMESHNFFGEEIKRGRLVKEVCDELGLEFVTPGGKYHYLSMPEFYRNIDCLVVSSTEEGFGLPIVEAGMMNKIVLGTKVGVLYDLFGSYDLPIKILRMEESRFKTDLKMGLLNNWKDSGEWNGIFFRNNFDWPHVIEPWVKFIVS